MVNQASICHRYWCRQVVVNSRSLCCVIFDVTLLYITCCCYLVGWWFVRYDPVLQRATSASLRLQFSAGWLSRGDDYPQQPMGRRRKVGVVINCSWVTSREEQLALGQPWVWRVSDLISLSLIYDGAHINEWLFLSLILSSSHRRCMVSVLVKAELDGGRGRWNWN